MYVYTIFLKQRFNKQQNISRFQLKLSLLSMNIFPFIPPLSSAPCRLERLKNHKFQTSLLINISAQ